jgi:hypothetical protein
VKKANNQHKRIKIINKQETTINVDKEEKSIKIKGEHSIKNEYSYKFKRSLLIIN